MQKRCGFSTVQTIVLGFVSETFLYLIQVVNRKWSAKLALLFILLAEKRLKVLDEIEKPPGFARQALHSDDLPKIACLQMENQDRCSPLFFVLLSALACSAFLISCAGGNLAKKAGVENVTPYHQLSLAERQLVDAAIALLKTDKTSQPDAFEIRRESYEIALKTYMAESPDSRDSPFVVQKSGALFVFPFFERTPRDAPSLPLTESDALITEDVASQAAALDAFQNASGNARLLSLIHI